MDSQTGASYSHYSKSSIGPYALALAALIVAVPGRAASLNPATVKAWDQYISSEKARMEERARLQGTSFLWIDEAPERANRVRAGEVLVMPLERQGLRAVPGGLIHHWIGAIFLPDTRIQDVLQVIRDYPHYKDLYQPSVTASKVIAKGETLDRFSTRLVNRSLLLKSAFETEYESCYVRVDKGRVYSFTRSTRIQEIEDYGSASQRALAEGEGSGIMWRLFSTTRYVERDGGVVIEVEAMGLTRDIPGALHWMVDPIVKRLSRSALITSLDETQRAARAVAEVARRDRGTGLLAPAGGWSSTHR